MRRRHAALRASPDIQFDADLRATEDYCAREHDTTGAEWAGLAGVGGRPDHLDLPLAAIFSLRRRTRTVAAWNSARDAWAYTQTSSFGQWLHTQPRFQHLCRLLPRDFRPDALDDWMGTGLRGRRLTQCLSALSHARAFASTLEGSSRRGLADAAPRPQLRALAAGLPP